MLSSNCLDAAALATHTPAQIVAFVGSTEESCLNNLFSYSAHSDAIFSEANLVPIASEIASRASAFSNENDQGLYEFLLFSRIGFYLKFYYPDSISFDKSKLQGDFTSAYQVLSTNAAVFSGQTQQSRVLQQFLNAIDTTELLAPFMSFVHQVLERAKANPTLLDSYDERNALYTALFIFQRITAHEGAAAALESSTIGLIGFHATNPPSNSAYEFLTSNAIWSLGNILMRADEVSLSESLRSMTMQQLTQAYHSYPLTSELYLRTVMAVTSLLELDCNTLSDGSHVCKAPIAEALRPVVFPTTYSFDDGALIVRTSLDIETIQPLYQAAKEIEAHFFRFLGSDEPVANDPNEPLTMYVYGSKSEYETYQAFLFNLPTSNGGIYIEQDTSFYTFQRASHESLYTLEELFRHEYVHYLVGKYIIQGFWGEAEIYNNGRMVWVDEGLAEYFAGGLRAEGVRNRRSVVTSLFTDGAQGRMQPSEIVSSQYSDGFKFYRYAGVFFDYLFDSRPQELYNLLSALLSGQVSDFDSEISFLASEQSIAAEYSTHLEKVVANIGNALDPNTTAPVDSELETFDPSIYEHFFEQEPLFDSSECSIFATGLNSRVACVGDLAINSGDLLSARSELSYALDAALASLSESPLNNLHFTVCYYSDLVLTTTQKSARYRCEGPLSSVAEALEQDLDGDGIPNASDPDDDNDGYSDIEEIELGRNPLGDEPTPSPPVEDPTSKANTLLSSIHSLAKGATKSRSAGDQDALAELISTLRSHTEGNLSEISFRGKAKRFNRILKRLNRMSAKVVKQSKKRNWRKVASSAKKLRRLLKV